jgi:hypothetical protein
MKYFFIPSKDKTVAVKRWYFFSSLPLKAAALALNYLMRLSSPISMIYSTYALICPMPECADKLFP